MQPILRCRRDSRREPWAPQARIISWRVAGLRLSTALLPVALSLGGATSTWTWNRPGSSWSVAASFDLRQQISPGIPDTMMWHATGGIGRRLNSRLALATQYAAGRVGNNQYVLFGSPHHVSYNAVGLFR